MIVIADAGSTKTDWRFVQNKQNISAIHTIGFNPVLTDTTFIINTLQSEFTDTKNNLAVSEVFYYGAGCWDEASCSVVSKALKVIFPNALIQVTNDLLGAARAVCGTTKGIACILGTGANSCLYDGKKVVDNVPALGYIMGDEGSGAYLGKQLLKAYFYRELPNILKEKLENQQTISKKLVIKNVYQKKTGNQYLANFTKFLHQEKAHPFIEQLIQDAFDQFIKRQVLKYENAVHLPIHFIGSIAYFFKDILTISLNQNHLTIGNVLQQPIDGLLNFHTSVRPMLK